MIQLVITLLQGLLAPFAAIGFILAVVEGIWPWGIPFLLFFLLSIIQRMTVDVF